MSGVDALGERATSAGRKRPGGDTAANARSVAYALFSQLVASPWEGDDRLQALPPVDLPAVLEELAAGLPFAVDLAPLGAASDALLDPPGEPAPALAERLEREYGGLFEVGSNGPPVPLREAHVDGRPSSTREEIVRFYEFFGYGLAAPAQWRPDHLSVELEFLHFLAFREASDDQGAAGLRRGQIDFLERHPLSWVPAVAALLAARSSGEAASKETIYYREILAGLAGFLERDAIWQRGSAGKEC